MPTTALIPNKLELRFKQVRDTTEALCKPLAAEDYVPQPMVDVSPPKWHLGHTTWFFETFLLKPFLKGYREYHPDFSYVFNSYYESVGKRVVRTNRGNLSRPRTEEIYEYRQYVNKHMESLLNQNLSEEALTFMETGLQHEQQHQELLVTDLKYILGSNPLLPEYKKIEYPQGEEQPINWLSVDEGIYQIGHKGAGFHWDNEKGAHKVYLHAFEAMDRLVTNAEFMEFMEAGGYQQFQWWLSDAWEWVKENQITAPLYWYKMEGNWKQYTLGGVKPIDPHAPVTHISFFEAEAYARWKGQRLLTEFEWEVLCNQCNDQDVHNQNFVDMGLLHPCPANGKRQLLGDCWEWTNSAYLPYPGYHQEEGALGEYNGKFMINQMVLRGGSCATPSSHIRPTYRNFFHTAARWQFTGIRLARK